jgi:hypothetical protein
MAAFGRPYLYRACRGSRGDPHHLGAAADTTRDTAIRRRHDAMKEEYDFSNATRGKFYRAGAQHIPPVHLDPDVLDYLAARAEARGISLSDLVNELLKKDIEAMESRNKNHQHTE